MIKKILFYILRISEKGCLPAAFPPHQNIYRKFAFTALSTLYLPKADFSNSRPKRILSFICAFIPTLNSIRLSFSPFIRFSPDASRSTVSPLFSRSNCQLVPARAVTLQSLPLKVLPSSIPVLPISGLKSLFFMLRSISPSFQRNVFPDTAP